MAMPMCIYTIYVFDDRRHYEIKEVKREDMWEEEK